VVDIGQKTLGARQGYCRGSSAVALTNEPLYGAQQSALCLQPSGETTNETISHLARLSQDDSLVIGYSHSTVETIKHATRLSKSDNLVTGYRQAINASQVAGYAFSQAQ
jgi:hypothetical protein